MDEINTQASRQSGNPPDGEDLVSLPAGYPLARYQLLETLGQGSFGITYRARDTQLYRDVAIKEYLPAGLAVRHGGTQVLPRSTRLADDFRWGRERFLSEAQTLARFEDARAIVRVYDFLEANGTAYMVMALLRGETLEDRLKRDGRLAPATLEGLLQPLLDGLERVHALGILHRDIKPANIMLDADDQPTLLDFGAARAAIAGRTQAMTAVYTPGYAAAEQFTSADQGPFTDIYGLAATLYQCVTGSMPPTAMERLLDDRLVPASQAARGRYPVLLLAGIDAGIALRAADRPQSIAAWRKVFAAGPVAVEPPGPRGGAVGGRESATRVSRHAVPAPPRPAGSARRWAIAAAVLLLVAAGSFGGYVYVRDAQQRAALERERVEAERRAAGDAAREKAAAEAREREAEAQRQAEAERVRLEEARRQAEAAEAEARRQAQMERAAEDQRQQEAARRKAEAEAAQAEAARRQAEAEAARRQQDEEARRAAAEEARRKADAEAQAARRQQDEEARRKAAEEARRKADADAQQAARRQQDEEARRKATEEARRKADADAQAARRQAADEARRKAEADAARRQQEEAARRPAGVDGTWSGTLECYPGGPKGTVSIAVAGGQGRGTLQSMKIGLRISDSSVVSDLAWIGLEGREWWASLRGRPAGNAIAITGAGRTIGGYMAYSPQCTMNLRRQ